MARDDDESRLQSLLIRWEELREDGVFASAEELCEGRPGLVGELARRIEALKCLDPLLDGPTEAGPGPEPPASSRGSAGSRVDYRDLKFHARGGLGEVFMARDTALNREVALKFIKGDRNRDPESRRRFRLEAEVTGRLEHPGVVPVYAVGLDDGGSPCYAMRFIRGTTLHDAVQEFHGGDARPRDPSGRAMAFRGLLRRFVSACNTIAYAHSRGVLHRDIKPRNVMLGRFDETLVVDWGLAKPFGAAESGPGPDEGHLTPSSGADSETPTVGVVGTPQYMSPEQAEGRWDIVGPPSDVYGLGATLFVLLTGRAPFEGRHPGQVLERVRRGEFDRPREAKAGVPRALEAICLKAMALDPVDRYPSALDLAADVERWLAGEPVSAWREPAFVRARRWVGRHRNLVTACVAALGVGVITLASYAVMQAEARQKIQDSYQKESRAKSIAENRLNLALEAVGAYKSQVAEDVLLRKPELKDLRAKLLQLPLTFYQKVAELPAEKAEDRRNRENLAALYANLAQVNREVGNNRDAIASYRRANDLLGAISRDDPRAIRPRADLAYNHNQVGLILEDWGRYPEALAELRAALALREQLARDQPGDADAGGYLANSRNNVALCLEQLGRRGEAIEEHRKTLAFREALVRDHPGSAFARQGLAMSYGNLGKHLEGPERLGHHRRALEIYESLWAADPQFPPFREGLITTLVQLAATLESGQAHDEAAATIGRCIAILEPVVAEAPTNAMNRQRLANAFALLGQVRRESGRAAEAAAARRRAIGLYRGLADGEPSNPGHRVNLARQLAEVASLEDGAGRPAEAEREFQEARDCYEGHLSAAPGDAGAQAELASLLIRLGNLQKGVGLAAQAGASYERARTLGEGLASSDPANAVHRTNLAITRFNQGNLERDQGDSGRAEGHYARSRDLLESLLAGDPDSPLCHHLLAGISDSVGLIRYRQSRDDEAAAEFRRAIGRGSAAAAAAPGNGDYLKALDAYHGNLIAALRRSRRDAEAARAIEERQALRSRPEARGLLLDAAFPVAPFGR